MKIKTIKKTKDRIDFNIKGIDATMANELRKIIISDIPTMAIEEVTFYDNSSVIHDEVLAHRLGLIPLKTNLKGPKSIKITLDTKGPRTVHAKELKVSETKIKGKKAGTEGIAVYGDTPIAKLTENQKIKLEATATLGTGKDHIKWQGGIASYEKKEDGSFDFFIESYGQMSKEEMVNEALDIFNNKIKDLKKGLK